MKIGFDVSQTGSGKAGCGYFADSLIQALCSIDVRNDYILYPHFGTSYWDPDGKKSTRMMHHPRFTRRVMAADRMASKQFWEEMTPDKEVQLGNPDIVHSNNFSCPKGFQRAKLVYTLHDLNFLEYPEFTTEENRWICFGGVFDASCHADYIAAVSDYSRKTFLNIFPHYPTDQISVVYEGSRFTFDSPLDGSIQSRLGLVSNHYWLGVGTLEPRKNLRRLLRAYAGFRKASTDCHPLVLAGGKGWMEDDLDAYISSLGLSGDVKLAGYVTDAELAWLYCHCFAFVYPSLYEGFGLPVLEAMSLGAPVITSNVTSLPEVAGDAGILINPLIENEIYLAMLQLTDHPGLRAELKEKSLVQAARFSWESTAERMLNIYRLLREYD
jgi:glycosyltransferase involved in cell wall biosynthesis